MCISVFKATTSTIYTGVFSLAQSAQNSMANSDPLARPRWGGENEIAAPSNFFEQCASPLIEI